MITLDVSFDVSHAIKALDALQLRQVPYATAQALTMTAQRVADAERREMRDVFDRPTPGTLNSLLVTPATKQTLTSVVRLADDRAKGVPASVYLKTEQTGGERALKRFELALRSIGVLPDGYFIVPGEAAEIDSYGNMNPGQIVKILSYFKAFNTAGFRANITDKRKRSLAKGTKSRVGTAYFVGRPGDGKLPLGIWQRFHLAHGSAIKPVLIFVDGARYEGVFDFRYVAELTVKRDFPIQFAASLAEALRTAR